MYIQAFKKVLVTLICISLSKNVFINFNEQKIVKRVSVQKTELLLNENKISSSDERKLKKIENKKCAKEPEVIVKTAGETIAEAALAQLGWNQDCTMLATNSIASVGINFHGWPEDYECLGNWTSDPQPGDLCIYSGHISVYVGNGNAVHGGWNGYTTVLSTVNCTNWFIGYIHINV